MNRVQNNIKTNSHIDETKRIDGVDDKYNI